MGGFNQKGCTIQSPDFALSAVFEILCLYGGHGLWEFTLMQDGTHLCWSASAGGASERVILLDVA